MQRLFDYKRYAVLYVDDEDKSLKYFKRLFSRQFRVLTANTTTEAYRILQEQKENIGVLMSDQRMPQEKGVDFLQRAEKVNPHAVRLLATGYAEVNDVIAAVNLGGIHRFVHKPWDTDTLAQMLKHSMELYIVHRERERLLEEKLSVVYHRFSTDRVIEMGCVAAGLGHYVNNALVGIRLFLDMLPKKLKQEKGNDSNVQDNGYWVKLRNNALAQVQHISDLLSELGTAVPGRPGHPFQDEVRLGTVFDQVLQSVRPSLDSKNLKVVCRIPESLPPVTGDYAKLRKLFTLLLEDEVVNLPDGKSIWIEAQTISKGLRYPEVQITVKDNGPCIPEEKLRSVFDPFSPRNGDPKEFGIYLMACYFIVYYHGGKIDVTSKAGEGTQFILTFPTKPRPRTAAEEERAFLAKVLEHVARDAFIKMPQLQTVTDSSSS